MEKRRIRKVDDFPFAAFANDLGNRTRGKYLREVRKCGVHHDSVIISEVKKEIEYKIYLNAECECTTYVQGNVQCPMYNILL